MRLRVLAGIILPVTLLVSTSCLTKQGSAASFGSQFKAKVEPYAFNLASWEYKTFLGGLQSEIVKPEPDSLLTSQNVIRYFSITAQENSLRSEMQAASAKNQQGDVSVDQAQ